MAFLGGIQVSATNAPRGYVCDVQVIAKGIPGGSEIKSLSRPAKNMGSHGGDILAVDFSAGYRVDVIADSRWRGISWSQNGRLIAKTVIAGNGSLPEHLAMIAYNPQNEDEQASLSCGAVSMAPWPSE